MYNVPSKLHRLIRPALSCQVGYCQWQQGSGAAAPPWGPVLAATACAAAASCLTASHAEGDNRHLQHAPQAGSSLSLLGAQIVAAAAKEDALPDLAALLCASPEIVGPCMLSLPLALMLGAAPPLDARTASALAQALPERWQGLQPWEVSALMRGVALLLGPALQVLRPEVVAAMRARLVAACQGLEGHTHSFDDIVSQAWALAVVCGGLPDDVLSTVQAALRALGSQQPSEAGLLLLLDALLLTASTQWRQQHPDTQPAHRVHAKASPQPRPSKEAVAALAAPAGNSLGQAMARLYADHVPLEGYFYGGALHTVLHSALVMPHLSGAAPPAAGSNLPLALACYLPEQCGRSAAAVTGSCMAGSSGGGGAAPLSVSRIHKDGARVRRDLQLHWRQDQLVDERQRAINDVTHLLEARMGETVQQPADLQIVLPLKKMVLVLEDDTTPSPPPFTLPVACACLERLCLERFCPQVRVERAATAPGLAAAREVALESGLGWKLVKVPPQQWRALLPKLDGAASALRGRPIMATDPEDVRAALVAQWISRMA